MLQKAIACVFLLGAACPVTAQEQQARVQPGWPCQGRIDPSYIRTAEATGGKVMLFAPTETSGLAEESAASSRHAQVLFRAAGELEDGVHEFEIPIDSTVESAYIFAAVQCLQFVTLFQPSGDDLPVDADGVEYHAFSATTLFVVRTPRPGTWTIRIAGRGFFSLVVSAKSALALTQVSLFQNDVLVKGPAPLGQPVRVQAVIAGTHSHVGLQFLSMSGATLRTFRPRAEEPSASPGTYSATIALPDSAFRVLVTGVDASGFPFQRVTARLFVGDR